MNAFRSLLLLFLSAFAVWAPAAVPEPKTERPPLEELDVLAPCPDADAKTFRPWTPAEAVSRLRACLAKVYPQPDAAGVTSEGGKDAKTLVVLLKGPQSMEDAGRLRAAIKRRHGKLYGYPVIVKMAGATSPRSSPPSKAT